MRDVEQTRHVVHAVGVLYPVTTRLRFGAKEDYYDSNPRNAASRWESAVPVLQQGRKPQCTSDKALQPMWRHWLGASERRVSFVVPAMTAQEIVPWFQMASTVLTGVGIIVSVSLGIASLNNNKRDRLLKIRPNLLFNIGGQLMTASISPLRSFPGKSSDDPEVQSFMSTLPADSKCLVLRESFGQLFNHGQGTAIDTAIWFEPQRITSGGQERWLTRTEQTSPPYTKDWNSIPATPANIPAAENASFYILPASVYSLAPHISAMSGRMRIECRDAEGNSVQWSQDATFFVERTDENNANVTVSFEPRSA
jgi:hypothetical protein